MATWSEFDRRCMTEALALARRGQGLVEPNPMVGCVIARTGRIVGRGWHRRFGGPHAEVFALRQAGPAARGATAYVTLEPCCHQGKTPPCTEALIAAGLRRVIVATRDPNPLVAGKGAARLRRAGVEVATGLLADKAQRLITPFTTFMTKGRPYFILKWAQSLDGKIATRTGDSKWISSLASRRVAHGLRARVDAVLVGVGTVLADDPELTARLARPRRVAARVILDSRLRTPPGAKLVRTANRIPTIIFTDAANEGSATWRRLTKKGCQLEAVSPQRLAASRRRAAKAGRGAARAGSGLDLRFIAARLHALGMTNVLVEGGGHVLASFVESKLANEAHIFIAPILIGGDAAPGPIRSSSVASVQQALGAQVESVDKTGPDLVFRLRFEH